MMHDLPRRSFLALTGAAVGSLALPAPALALSSDAAETLVTSAVVDVNAIIASGASEAQMLREFQGVFERYADTAYVAAFALGNDGRSATTNQKRNFSDAFGTYVARKYGSRFREFIGGEIIMQGARPERNYMVVDSTAVLQGESPFELEWHVSDRTGRPLFFNLIIEGVNMLLAERTEVGALLDRRGGNIDALIEDLRNA